MNEDDEDRFWKKVDIRGSDDCWGWTASKNNDGYGQFHFKRKCRRAHRVVLVIFGRMNISDDVVVMHTCDNPSCVNPNHLVIGTQSENMWDASKKGRLFHSDETKKGMSEIKSGENNPMFGKRHSDEEKKVMSERQGGKKNSFFGMNHSEETKKRISESLKGEKSPFWMKRGEKSSNWGIKRTKSEKKRMSLAVQGENNPMAKLTVDDVLKIRKMYKVSDTSYVEIAEVFSVSPVTIRDIIKRRRWKHVK